MPGFKVGGIQHDQCQVRTLQFSAGTTHAFAFDVIAPFTQAGGIHQGQFQSIQTDDFVQGVARSARHVGDDGAVTASQCIQQ